MWLASYTKPHTAHKITPTSSELELASLSKVYRLRAKASREEGPLGDTLACNVARNEDWPCGVPFTTVAM